jgi:NAD(P)H-dependent FMN reductase
MPQPQKIALITGRTRMGRFRDTIAAWARREIESRAEFSLDLIDPLELDLPQRQGAEDTPAQKALQRRIGAADAYVVITPEYNHSFPAPLKQLIDTAYSEWQAKPVAFIGYGGFAGGARAIEQLRQVFAELQTVTLRDAVSFANAWEKFDAEGDLLAPYRARKSMATMLTRLDWWARALREARNAQTFPMSA